MGEKPRLGELLLGTEGLALLRLAFTGDEAMRDARVTEMRDLLAHLDDPDLAAALAAPEYDLKSGYALWSKTYDAPLRLFSIEEPAMQALFDMLDPGTVLDAACGTGRHSVELVRRGHRVVGVDRSETMLEKARAKLPDADFRVGDLEALPADDHAFDAVVCGLALVHLPDLHRVMAEFERVLHPGGRVIVSDVHPFLTLLGWQAQFRTGSGDAGFMRLHRHMLSDYTKAAAAAGLWVRSLQELPLTKESAVTVASERLPEANRAAWVGLPGVVVWEFGKP
ncbi:class I SAM-dependent methyltransferase [Labrenzia aggregata]|uniref:Class I SAM-dependent methyltransferase n=2 Tax=Roseibium aggregatum TaxID=187304 RepID=A0A926NZN2_9HYPH|nr:class I SAM-dependent methyltransferase [Roseibium aggregatum]